MKVICAAFLCLCAVGCGTCRDGSGRTWTGASEYRSCGMKCVGGDKECRCSTGCPCWKKHS